MVRTDSSISPNFSNAIVGKNRRSVWKRRIIKGCLVTAFVLLTGLLLFSWWLGGLSGDTYEGKPEFILPSDTIAMGSYRDLSGTLDALEGLPAVVEMTGGKPLGGWLLTGPVWGDDDKALENKGKFTATADRFLRRYFGEELTVALVPALKDGAHSALLMVVKAELGFEENLSELAVLYNPKFKFESEEYNGVQLRLYADKKLERSFSYCRLGNTVVLCLRSRSLDFLKSAVDRSQDPETEALGNESVFVESMRNVPDVGLRFFARPLRLPEGLRTFPSEMASSDSWAFWFDYFEQNLDGVVWLTGSSEVDGEITAHFRMPAIAQPDNQYDSFILRQQANLSSGTLLFLGVEHSELSVGLSDVFARLQQSPAYTERWDEFSRHWFDGTGSSLSRDWAGGGIQGAAMSVDALYSGILGPVPVVSFGFNFEKDETSQILYQMAGEIRTSLLGISHYRSSGPVLEMRLNGELPGNHDQNPVIPDMIMDDIPEEGRLIVLAFLAIDRVRESLMITGPPGGAWNLRTKEKLREWRTLLDTLSGLRRLNFILHENNDIWEAEARLILR